LAVRAIQLQEGIGIAIDQDESITQLGKSLGDSLPQVAGSAGDDGSA
jgi:hypothetical protein